MFRIIFVLDILKGNTVHAVRGERARYQPIKGSIICDSSYPLDIISVLSPKEVYVADLDSLQHLGNNFELIKKISSKTRTMVDTGAEKMSDIEQNFDIADTVVLGTETASLELIESAASDRINVSIDIKNGTVFTKDRQMEVEPEGLVKILNEYDIGDIIVLELSKVGTEGGIDTDFLQDIAGLSAHNVLVGGGIRDLNDIEALEKIGISGALVATAAHNGKIPPEYFRG